MPIQCAQGNWYLTLNCGSDSNCAGQGKGGLKDTHRPASHTTTGGVVGTTQNRAAPATTEAAPVRAVSSHHPVPTGDQDKGSPHYAAASSARNPFSRFGKVADTLAVLFAVATLIAAIAAAGIIADAIPAWAFVLSLFGVLTCGLVILWRLP